MRVIARFLFVVGLTTFFVACSDGNGKSQQVQLPDPPAAPLVTVDADIKQLIFSWDAVAGATHYRLLENPDGHSGFTQVGDNVPSSELSVTRDIAVHLHDWVNALYIAQACNSTGCTGSAEVSVTELMLDAIGYIRLPGDDSGDLVSVSAVNADGTTFAISKWGGNSGHPAVYVFRFVDNNWFQQAEIPAPTQDLYDGFGNSLALSADGNTLAVGSRLEDSSATGINGDQSDNSSENAGAAYIYQFDGTQWTQQVYIKAASPDAEDEFGWQVALSADGNTLAVSALREDSAATGINGDQNDNSTDGSGAVLVYKFDGATWSQQAYIKASISVTARWFGKTLALSADGNTLVASASMPDEVYTYYFNGTQWAEQSIILSSGDLPNRAFGYATALSADGGTLAVSAVHDRSAGGICNDRTQVSSESFGNVHIYRFDGTLWSEQAKLEEPGEREYSSLFGNSLALSADGDILAIGAFMETSGERGVNGVQIGHPVTHSGAAYVYHFDGADWLEQAHVKAITPIAHDWFGQNVVLSADGNTLAVGTECHLSSRGVVYLY